MSDNYEYWKSTEFYGLRSFSSVGGVSTVHMKHGKATIWIAAKSTIIIIFSLKT